MPLIDIYRSNRDSILTMNLPQIVNISGDGKLSDGSESSRELREFFSLISSDQLGEYADTCLSSPFEKSGLVLQEIVNELGSRLDCRIEHGLYSGRKGSIGFDGIWHYPDGHSLVVEVKTTDAYSINLDTVAEYRKRLIQAQRLDDSSSILIVVGRKDTGGLEAQVRGSKHGWDMRIISVDALVRLVKTKEDADNNTTISMLRSILIPQEITRLDFIVDLLATTADDIKSEMDSEESEPEESDEAPIKKVFSPETFNMSVAERAQQTLGLTLKKATRSLFVNTEKETGLICVVSKPYQRATYTSYWFAFHPHQKYALEEYQNAHIAFGCGSSDKSLLIPFKEFVTWLPNMNTTEKGDKTYWHVKFQEDDEGNILTRFKSGSESLCLNSYLI